MKHDTTYQIEDMMPKFIKECLMKGSYRIPAKQWYPDYVGQFFNHYEQMMQSLELQAIPLTFHSTAGSSGPGEKIIRISRDFMKQVSQEELKKFRALLERRFKQFYQDDLEETIQDDAAETAENLAGSSYSPENDYDDGDGDEAEGDIEAAYAEEEMPDLPYRAENETYIGTVIQELFDIDDAPEDMYMRDVIKTDSYGMIEDRRQIFFRDVMQLCHEYRLPKFPISFDKNGKPYFIAGEKEVSLMKILLFSRIKKDDETKKIARHYIKYDALEYRDGVDIEKMDEAVAARIEMNERIDRVREFNRNKWPQENRGFVFPSRIDTYNGEFLNSFDKNDVLDLPNNDLLLMNEDDLVKPEEVDQAEGDEHMDTDPEEISIVQFNVSRLMLN